jgi:hypothetical protein
MEPIYPASIPNLLKGQNPIIEYIIYVREYNTTRINYNK